MKKRKKKKLLLNYLEVFYWLISIDLKKKKSSKSILSYWIFFFSKGEGKKIKIVICSLCYHHKGRSIPEGYTALKARLLPPIFFCNTEEFFFWLIFKVFILSFNKGKKVYLLAFLAFWVPPFHWTYICHGSMFQNSFSFFFKVLN